MNSYTSHLVTAVAIHGLVLVLDGPLLERVLGVQGGLLGLYFVLILVLVVLVLIFDVLIIILGIILILVIDVRLADGAPPRALLGRLAVRLLRPRRLGAGAARRPRGAGLGRELRRRLVLVLVGALALGVVVVGAVLGLLAAVGLGGGGCRGAVLRAGFGRGALFGLVLVPLCRTRGSVRVYGVGRGGGIVLANSASSRVVKSGSSSSRTASMMSFGWMVFLDVRPACSAALVAR
jgi:hypothetical protein